MSRRLPKLPGWLQIGTRTYTVDVDDAVVDEEYEGAGFYAGAFSDPATQRIVLRSGVGHDETAETLLHEVLHQCLRASGCWPDSIKPGKVGFGVEEQTVAAMTGPLLRVMRDHPELVRYLTARPDTASREGTV